MPRVHKYSLNTLTEKSISMAGIPDKESGWLHFTYTSKQVLFWIENKIDDGRTQSSDRLDFCLESSFGNFVWRTDPLKTACAAPKILRNG